MLVGGKRANGYLEEEAIPEDSFTETYAALRCPWTIGDGRGCRFIRSGKRLAMKASEIVVQFSRPPAILFGEESVSTSRPTCWS